MKRTFLIILALLLLSFSTAYGQIADGISYQAVALDEKGKEIAGHDINGSIIHSSQIKVRFSIIGSTPDGTILYTEEHSTYTDQYGLFSLVIGHGDASSDGLYQKLTDIEWGADKLFLKVEIDIKSKGNFKLMGIQQMMAVPFAFHALTSSSSATVNYSDIINKPDFSLVATTGSYLDLLNKPVFDLDYNTLINKPLIPSMVSELLNDAGFMTSYIETDPLWTTASGSYYTRTNMQTSGGSQLHFNNITNKPTTLSGYGITDAFSGTWASLSGRPTTISGYGITDAMSNTSPANGITSANISNWNAAFSWGSHVGLYRPLTYVPVWTEITSNPFQFTSPANSQLIRYNTASGRWENFTPAYLTSYTETDPLWTTAAAGYYTRTNMQTSGGSQLHFNNITNRPTTISGYGITDAMGTSHAANAITGINIVNWNTAFSWGNHSGLYRPITYVPGWSEITSNPFLITSPVNNQLIRYNSGSGRWENWVPDFLTSFSETDPLFALWDKNAGIIITTSQISDFQSGVTNNPAVLANTAKNTYPAADAVKLASIAVGAEVNVNADWTAITGDAQILNKPSLFSGNFNDLTNKPILDGSETKIVGGTNINITGTGSDADPYIVNSSNSDNNSGHFKIFYSSNNFVVPNGTTHLIVEAWGGGGGGAGGTRSTCGMGGDYIGSNGSAGTYTKKVITVVPNESINITIGLGGSAGCGGCNIVGCDYLGTNGTAGGGTSIGSYLTVSGGSGGSWGWGTSCTAGVGTNGQTPGEGGKSGCGFNNGGNGGSGMMIIWY